MTFALGVLIGQGHVLTPTASAIVRTMCSCGCTARGGFTIRPFWRLGEQYAAIAELSRSVMAAGPNARRLAIVVNLLTIVSMFVRNLGLLLIFSPPAGFIE